MPAGDDCDDDGTLAAVVAHGLLSSVAVTHAAALTLRRVGERMDVADRIELLDAMSLQSDLLVEATTCFGHDTSHEIVGSATVVRLAARTLLDNWDVVGGETRGELLAALDRHGDRLKALLLSVVRGLDAEAIELLDSLAADHR